MSSPIEAIRLSELGSTFFFETSVFHALSAGNGTEPSRLAPMPRLAFAIDPYCQTGYGTDSASAGANAIMAAETADAGRAGSDTLMQRLWISMPRQHSG
jgi:hypothetical protein